MSLRTPRERRRYILENIAFKKIEDIASDLKVSEKTIDRDIKKLKKTGEWKRYIESTILKLSQSGDVDDSTKFKEFMKIYAKEFVDRHQVEATGDLVFKLQVWRPEDDDSTDKVPST